MSVTDGAFVLIIVAWVLFMVLVTQPPHAR